MEFQDKVDASSGSDVFFFPLMEEMLMLHQSLPGIHTQKIKPSGAMTTLEQLLSFCLISEKKNSVWSKVHKFLFRKKKNKHTDQAATFSDFIFSPKSKGFSSQKERIVALASRPQVFPGQRRILSSRLTFFFFLSY